MPTCDSITSTPEVRCEIHPRHTAFKISTNGEVWSRKKPGRHGGFSDTWKPIKPIRLRSGHCQIGLGWKDGKLLRDYVHRMVLETFVGPCPPGCEARHLNGNPSDNRLENLRWGSPHENFWDSVEHGTAHCLNFENKPSRLDKAQIQEIVELLKQGESAQKIADRFGVSYCSINQISAGRARVMDSGLSVAAPAGRRRNRFTPDQILAMVEDHKRGIQVSEISKKYGINNSKVYQILKGKHWASVTGLGSAKRRASRLYQTEIAKPKRGSGRPPGQPSKVDFAKISAMIAANRRGDPLPSQSEQPA